MATLGTVFTGAAYATSGKKTDQVTQPPINAKSPQEENFVKYVQKKAFVSRCTCFRGALDQGWGRGVVDDGLTYGQGVR